MIACPLLAERLGKTFSSSEARKWFGTTSGLKPVEGAAETGALATPNATKDGVLWMFSRATNGVASVDVRRIPRRKRFARLLERM